MNHLTFHLIFHLCVPFFAGEMLRVAGFKKKYDNEMTILYGVSCPFSRMI